MFGHSDAPLFCVRPACLDGVRHRLFPALAHGDLFIHRVLLYVLQLLFTRLTNQDGIQPSSFGIVAVLSLSNRIQLLHNLSTFTPPTALLQYLGGQVEWPGLFHSSTSPTCCRRPSQISESRSSRRLDPSTRLAICELFVRKLTRSPLRLSLASPSAWKTSCLHSKRIMHGRELRCVATEIVQEPASSLDLLMVQDCTEQYSLAASDDKFRALLADQPQIFALIFFYL